MKFGLIFFAVFALSVVAVAMPAPAQQAALDLGDGYKFELLGAGDTKARVGNPKSIFVQVALTDSKIQNDKKKLLEAADRLFESVLMGAAEKGYYKSAAVRLRKSDGGFNEFVYLRGDNDVWLRQKGVEPWMTAQDPAAWTPAATQKVDVQGFGTFAVEGALEVPPPAGFKRVAEIDFITATPLTSLQRKFLECKALWARIDREQMRKDGYDLVLLGNFTGPQRGRFHARKGFFVRIPREGNGPWPELPEKAPQGDALLVSENAIQPEQLADLIRSTFAIGLGKAPATDAGMTPAAAPTAAPLDGEVRLFGHYLGSALKSESDRDQDSIARCRASA